MTKTCTKCGETKPRTEFYKDAQKRDGLTFRCKTCNVAAAAVWQKANAGKCRAAVAKYRAANPEKDKAATDKWRAANHVKVKATKAAYKAANPEANRICRHNRRAREHEAEGRLSTGIAKRLFILQRGKCACCKHPLGDKFHRDHRMPLAKGGSNTDDNIQLLCPTCNQQKCAKDPIDFMQQKGYLL